MGFELRIVSGITISTHSFLWFLACSKCTLKGAVHGCPGAEPDEISEKVRMWPQEPLAAIAIKMNARNKTFTARDAICRDNGSGRALMAAFGRPEFATSMFKRTPKPGSTVLSSFNKQKRIEKSFCLLWEGLVFIRYKHILDALLSKFSTQTFANVVRMLFTKANARTFVNLRTFEANIFASVRGFANSNSNVENWRFWQLNHNFNKNTSSTEANIYCMRLFNACIASAENLANMKLCKSHCHEIDPFGTALHQRKWQMPFRERAKEILWLWIEYLRNVFFSATKLNNCLIFLKVPH